MANNKEYINAYNAAHYTKLTVRFRNDNEIDRQLLEHAKAQGSTQLYIKRLILRDLDEAREQEAEKVLNSTKQKV